MTESERFKQLKPEFGCWPARRMARKEYMLKALEQAKSVDDLRIIIKRIITEE